MKFETVQEAFNHYKNAELSEIEKRAKEIGKIIDTDEKADVAAYNIELEGMKAAKANIETRASVNNLTVGTSLITGVNVQNDKITFGDDVLAAKEYRSAFYKNLQGRELTDVENTALQKGMEKRANEYATSTNTAAVIPTATMDEIIEKVHKQGGLLAEARQFSMPVKISIPIATPSTAAAWHVEGAAVDSEKPNISLVSFDGNEILKVFSISYKVQTMDIDGFESYLVDELSACVLDTIGNALVNGTGSGQGLGILPGITWTADNSRTSTAAQITYNDITQAIGLLPRGYSAGAKIAMSNRTLWQQIYSVVDASSRPIFLNDPKNETIGTVLGFEVVIDEYIPDGVLLIGNFAKYLGYNLPGGIVVEASRESSFKSGLIDYRALCIADCKPLVDEAFVKITARSAT